MCPSFQSSYQLGQGHGERIAAVSDSHTMNSNASAYITGSSTKSSLHLKLLENTRSQLKEGNSIQD